MSNLFSTENYQFLKSKKSLQNILFTLIITVYSINAETLNKTLAVVNGEPILQSEYDKLANPIFENYKNIVEEVDKTGKKVDLKKEILQQMINDRLVLQQAKKNKITVTKKEIEDGVKEIKSRFKKEEEFKKELLTQGITIKEFEDRIKDQIMMIKLIDREIKSKVAIPTDQEIEKFYNENKEKMVEPERVRVKHILITVDEKDPKKSDAKTLVKIKEVEKKLKAGGDFNELAKEYSDDTGSKERGGDLGYIMKGDTVPEFEKIAFSLDIGKLSEIFKTKFGYHILIVTEKKIAVKKTLEEVREYLKSFLYQQNMEEEYTKWIKSVREKADIKINE